MDAAAVRDLVSKRGACAPRWQVERYDGPESPARTQWTEVVMRIAVVGAGIAGALLALRLHESSPRPMVEILGGDHPPEADATGASGGLVRGFERDAAAARLATESLAELRTDMVLRDRAGYREIGSVYLLPPGVDPDEGLAAVDHLLPGSTAVLDRTELIGRFPFRDLPEGTVGVVEQRAGHISPARLRAEVLSQLARRGVDVRRRSVRSVATGPRVHLVDGATLCYDAVVVAAGAWTPRLLATSGLDAAGLRTRQIQYSIHPALARPLGAFVDDTTGLYGRPTADGALLVGLPSTRWDIPPEHVVPDAALAEDVVIHARRRLRILLARTPTRVVASFDCYHEPTGRHLLPGQDRDRAGLALRRCGPSSTSGLFTFTGGSGGAAKAVLAASRIGAAALLGG
jgi:glycine/D-amino acid oxidase-like deaminating enzyme